MQKIQIEMVDDKLTWDTYTVTPTTGQTITAGDTKRNTLIYVNPAAPLATLNVVLPTDAGSSNGQIICLQFSKVVTTLNITGATTIYNAPVTADTGESISLQKSTANVWTTL